MTRGYSVRTEYDVYSNTVNVWILSENREWLYRPGQALTARWEAVTEGTRPDPSMSLPAEAFRALIESAPDFVKPDTTLQDAVKDARATRDRLLAMVERAFPHG